MLNPFKRLVELYWRFLVSPEKYLRHIGVTIGKDCFISSRAMNGEPYLITIGNHVQVTRGVAIHCHGGVILFGSNILILMPLVRS